jgi:hypothetical protein
MKIWKSAALLLFDLMLVGALGAAWYYGWLTTIWNLDALKLSFVIIPAFFATAFAITFDWISDETAENIENRLPMIALCGTVYGILSVFSVLATARFGGASDFKALIGPLLAGGGSAMWPTFLALAASNLLWLHQVVRRI